MLSLALSDYVMEDEAMLSALSSQTLSTFQMKDEQKNWFQDIGCFYVGSYATAVSGRLAFISASKT
jgi:hypothetical protein